MIPLLDKPNVMPADAEYPYGDIRDREPGQANGTPVNREVYADHHQFFEELMSDNVIYGGDAPNGLPDNYYNGFQLNRALDKVIDFFINLKAILQNTIAWEDASALLVNNWVNEGSGTYHDIEYYKDPWGWVHLRGHIKRNNAVDGDGLLIFTLPADYRPSKKENQHGIGFSGAGYGGKQSVGVSIETDGKVTPYAFHANASGGVTVDLNVLLLLNQANDFLCLDGIHWKTDTAP